MKEMFKRCKAFDGIEWEDILIVIDIEEAERIMRECGASFAELVEALNSLTRVASFDVSEAAYALRKELDRLMESREYEELSDAGKNASLAGRALRSKVLRGHAPVNMNRMQHK